MRAASFPNADTRPPCALVNHPSTINPVRLKLVNQFQPHRRQRFQVDGHPVSKNRKSAQVRPQARIASTPRSDPSQRTPLRCVLRPGPHRPGLSERNQGLNQLCVPTGRMLTTTRNLWRNPTTQPPDQKEPPSPTFHRHHPRHPAQNPVHPVHRCKTAAPLSHLERGWGWVFAWMILDIG